MTRFVSFAAVLSSVSLLLPCCSKDEEPMDCMCIDSDCESGYVCNMELCQCALACTSDEDCGRYMCCRNGLCVSSECLVLDCGSDSVCGMEECGTCLSGEVCNNGQCSGGQGCKPLCPEGSECRDLDSLESPECVWPSGSLACTDDSHCPIVGMGYCGEDNSCHFGPCECSMDEECEPDEFCHTYSKDCGRCANRHSYACESDSDCVVAVSLACCDFLMSFNVAAFQEDACFAEYPLQGDPGDDCVVIDCLPEQHCWPLPEETPVAKCINGACRLDPPPFP